MARARACIKAYLHFVGFYYKIIRPGVKRVSGLEKRIWTSFANVFLASYQK